MNTSTAATNTTSHQPYVAEKVFQVVTALYFSVAAYIFAALIRYELINGKFKGPYLNRAFLMKIIAMLSSLSVAITTQTNFLVAIGILDNDLFVCTITSKLHAIIYSVGITCTYAFLWLRQSLFYSKKDFKYLNSQSVRAFSSLTIVLMVFSFIAHFTVYLKVQIGTLSMEVGCKFLAWNVFQKIFFRYCPAVDAVTTLTLFGLFLYPLLANTAVKYYRTNQSNTVIKHEIRRAIRISIVSLVACIISDGLAVLLENVTDSVEIPYFYLASFYDLSLLVNVMVLVLTYDKWVEILFWRCRRRPDELV